MNINEIRETARMATIAELMPAFEQCSAVKWCDNGFAILQNVDGQEVWVSVDLTVKSWKDTKRSKAFDPYEEAAAWEEEKRIKAGVKAQKEAEKAAKIAKDAEKREKVKEQKAE